MDPSAGRTARRQRLAQRRKGLGLTQEDLADLLGVERSTVVRWERGETEPLPWIRPRLAKALRVSADRLEELLADGGPGDVPASAARVPAEGNEPGAGPAQVVPQQLPAAVPDFTGRAGELGALTRILDESAGAGTPGTVVISAIGGTAGVGKTALALHWAHQVAHRFGDGHLHVNLRGFDPSGSPATPAEAVRGFLDALGVPPNRVPPDPDAQAGLYRSLLADRTMLIVLDNARDEQQVRPLLPASSRSLVLVTSRNQLTGLAANYGARLLYVDVLAHAEAVQLLTARVGPERAASEPAAIAEIATLCARLPLALTIAAASAAARPRFPLTALAAELHDAVGRLDALDAGDAAASVRAVFSWSYRQLDTEAARMFRLLGLHPGPDISVPAAASLAATSEPDARRLLRELTRDCLITEQVPGRFALHDLLRAYAAVQARDRDRESDRAAAVGRLLDHYLHTAGRGLLLMDLNREPVTLSPPSPGTAPEQIAGNEQAQAWFAAEYKVLLAAVSLAADSGYDVHAWQLPWAVSFYLEMRGHWDEQVSILATGLAAATRLGDTAAQAVSCLLLGNGYAWLADYEQASAHFRQSLELCRRLGDRPSEAKAHANLGVVAERQGRYAEAIDHSEQALRLFQALGHAVGEAKILNNIGWYVAHLGDYERARAFCRRAVGLSAVLGDHRDEGLAWDSLGYIEHHVGNFSQAAACYERALDLVREAGDRFEEAEILVRLGDTREAAGDPSQAGQAWQQALAILDELAHSLADEVRAKLAGLDD